MKRCLRSRKILAIITTFLVLLGFIGWFSYQVLVHQSQIVTTETKLIEIPKGTSFNAIVGILQNNQINIQPFWFKLIAHGCRLADKIQAGEYEIKQGLNTLELLHLLAEGRVKQYSLTFPEGWSFKEILQLVNKTPNLQHLLNTHDDVETLIKKLALNKAHPEGWFFPDTYLFTKNTTDVALLKRAHLKMQSVLDMEWQQKQQDLPLQDNYQALILASIIEKETGLGSERPQIAGVFMRRLQKGMLLQTDPTVIYGMGDAYKGDIRSKDLKKLTPYNTYVIQGLPPTPIAMPGADAIRAAMHPAEGESLYFVAKGDGSHVFSNTLAEHNQAVIQFLNRQDASASISNKK